MSLLTGRYPDRHHDNQTDTARHHVVYMSPLDALGLTLCLTLLTVSCGRTAQSTTKSNDPLKLPHYGLAMGLTEFDNITPALFHDELDQSALNDGLGPCVAISNDNAKMGGYRAAQISQNIDTSYSYDWIEAGLDVTGKIEGRVAGISAGSVEVESRFHAANVNSQVSYAHATDFRLDKGTLFLSDIRLNDIGQPLADRISSLVTQLKNADDSSRPNLQRQLDDAKINFYLRCGDRFASQITLGASFASAIRMHFADNLTLLNFYVHAETQVAKMKYEQSESKDFAQHLAGSVLEIDVMQEGGDQGQFAALRTRLGLDSATGGGSAVASRCFTSPLLFDDSDSFRQKVKDELQTCFDVYKTINTYLKDDFYQQIQNSEGTFSPKSTITGSYYESGLVAANLNMPPALQKALSQLNTIRGQINLLKLLVRRLADDSERADAAVSFNASESGQPVSAGVGIVQTWNKLKQRMGDAKPILTGFISLLEDRSRACVAIIKSNSQSASCAVPDLNLRQFQDLFLNLDLTDGVDL